MAPCRKADAPAVIGPRRRKTDAPSSPSVSPCCSTKPQTPPRRPEQPEHRVTFGPDPQQVGTPSPVAVDPSSPNPRLQQATQQNLAQVDEANLQDTVTIGELGYLTADPAFYFAAPVEEPDDSFDAPDWFLNELQTIASATVPTPDKATIRFKGSANAADFNADLLRSLNYSIPDLLESQRGTTVSFGSEFRPVNQVRGLLSKHPGFGELEKILTYGMDYCYLNELTDDERLDEMLANLQRGNHKPAQDESNQVAKLLKKRRQPWFFMDYPETPSALDTSVHGPAPWPGQAMDIERNGRAHPKIPTHPGPILHVCQGNPRHVSQQLY
jgi:hypothetical protein